MCWYVVRDELLQWCVLPSFIAARLLSGVARPSVHGSSLASISSRCVARPSVERRLLLLLLSVSVGPGDAWRVHCVALMLTFVGYTHC